jgi:uncharacterized delta-60 repeat protein
MQAFLFRHVVLLACLWLLIPASSWGQNANDGYNPNANYDVCALAVQPDGKTLVAGGFTSIAGGTHTYLARLRADGTADPGFTNNVLDNGVESVAIQADGGIVIGGAFTQVGAFARNRIARLNADGSVDSTFDPNANSDVIALAVQSDGKILLGGLFTTLAGGATTRNHIARLNADGSVDITFDPNANSDVSTLAVQSDGKILLGGLFTTLAGGATPRNYIARLNANGSVDGAFDPNASSTVYALAVQPDGKILLGGSFTTLAGGATTRNRVARLNADGSVDTFNPNANDAVGALAMQPDGKILLGGLFTTLAGGATTRNRIARLNTDGSVDSTFDPNANSNVYALAVQPDGKILLGGHFTTLAGGAKTRNYIARLYADGSVDSTFDPNANSQVLALAVQPDGKILLGGAFTTLAGCATTCNHIARLNADGSVDGTFHPNANGDVHALAVQPDGKILLGGGFMTLAGCATTCNHIARLNADGSVDGTFHPNANGDVYALAVQPDGKILIAGVFTTLAGCATTCNYVARLNANGSVDSTFDPNANSLVLALAVQPDGKILLGGAFTTLAGCATTCNYIARLNANGSVDSTFNPNANGNVTEIAVQPDGKILIAGGFTTLAGGATTRNYIARLNANGSVDSAFDPNANSFVDALAVQPDGRILLGGSFTTLAGGATTRNYVARLNANGSVDGTFNSNPNSYVYALAVQPDGKIVLGGNFTTLAGGATARNYIARLSTPDAALQSVTTNGATVTWLRSGTGPELALPPTLEFSVGGVTYAPLGTLSRISGGWRGGGLTQPVGEIFYVRLRGAVSSGEENGSQGLIESVVQFFGNDRIFADGFQ